MSSDLQAYLVAHPDASPQEVFAHFGIQFDRTIWNAVLRAHPDLVRVLRASANPHDRAWTDEPS